MSYNGSGTFIINTTGQPVVDGTVISSTVFNALTADLANGLTTALTKDGQSTVTNNIPLNGYKITNLGAGTVATDAVQLGQLQSGGFSTVTVTGTDTYVGTMTPTLPAYTAGNFFTFVVPNTNTGPATLNINSLGAKVLSRDGSTALAAGDLVAGSEVAVVYDGTRFQVLNSNSKTNFTVSGTAALSAGTTNGIPYLTASKVVTTGAALSFDGTNFATTGSVTGTSLIPSGSSIPANGIYLPSANTVGVATASTQRMTVGASGNVTINTPASGTSLTVANTTASSSVIGSFVNATTGTSFSINSPATSGSYLFSTAAGDVAIRAEANNMNIGAVSGNTSISTSARTIAIFSSSGNVTVNSPASGTALTVNGDVYLSSGNPSISGVPTSTGFFIDNRSTGKPTFIRVSNATALDTTPMQFASTGNVTINTPASGAALVINGIPNGRNFQTSDGTEVLSVQTDASHNYNLGVDGAHSLSFFTNGSGNPRIVTNSSGNVTINAPSSGTALSIPATAQVTLFGSTTAANAYSAWQYNSTSLGYVGNGAGVAVGAGATDFAIGSTGARALWLGSNDTARVKLASTGEVTFSASAATTPGAVTFSATAMTVDCRVSNVFTTTFTANVTTAPSLSNPTDGQTINWFITQDATGSRTMTWPTSFKWPGGSAGVLSTAANSVDLLVATYRSSTGFWYATLSKGFA